MSIVILMLLCWAFPEWSSVLILVAWILGLIKEGDEV